MRYRCGGCGYITLKWLGRCPHCGAWDTFTSAPDTAASGRSARAASAPLSLAEVPLEQSRRIALGIEEFDRVLGGGVIGGSLVLIGGEPGIGKSTLLLQAAGELARAGPVVYVSGEEAPGQLKLRAERLSLSEQRNLLVLSEHSLPAIAEHVSQLKPVALIVDSLQAVFPEGGKEGIGSAAQVGQTAFELNQIAQSQKIPVFLIGHITKSGEFAGPKAIEHMVDVAVYLEGGRDSDIRILRAVKNRYGSTEEIGVFQMQEQGLKEIRDPSKFFTARSEVPQPGTVVVPSLEGTRPILVELQALVASTRAGYPQRRATGLDYNRVLLLLAVIEKRLDLHIGGEDIYLNVAGGLTLRETAIDLGVVAAVVSSFKNRAVDRDTVMIGEVGLAGEVRRVKKLRERLLEAATLGYNRAIVPAGEKLGSLPIAVVAVSGLEEAMSELGL